MSRHQSGGRSARPRAFPTVSTKKHPSSANAKFGKASIDSFRIRLLSQRSFFRSRARRFCPIRLSLARKKTDPSARARRTWSRRSASSPLPRLRAWMSRAALSAMAPERGFRGARSPRARSACAGDGGGTLSVGANGREKGWKCAHSRSERGRGRAGAEAWARRGAGPGRAAASRRATGSGGWRGGPARAEPDPERSPGRPARGIRGGRCRVISAKTRAPRGAARGEEKPNAARARTERGRGRPPRAKRPPRRSETRGFEDRGGSPGAPSAPSRASRGALCRTGRRRSRTEQRWRVQTSGAKVRQAANQSAERNFGLKGRIDSDRV